MSNRLMTRVAAQWRNQTGDRSPEDASRTSSGVAYSRGSQYDPYSGAPVSRTNEFFQWIKDTLELKKYRRADMDLYAKMDSEMPEIASALDAYADNATQVGMTRNDANQEKNHIVQIVTKNERVEALLKDIRDRLRMDDRAWALARDLTKNGEVFEEIVVRRDLKLDRLKQLPARSIIRNEDAFGILDPKNAFLQVGEDLQKVDAIFEDWEVAHFRLQRRNEDRYGTAILHPVRRVFKQLQLVEDSMLLARMTRAHSKLVFKVDTGALPPPMAYEHVTRVKNDHRKRRMIDPVSGRMRSDMNPLTNEEDIFIGVSKGSQGGVDQLYGDLNIGNLEDVYYFQNKLFGGMKVPKSYLGIERDVNAKATLTNQDIQFARSVRRVQLAMRIGYHRIMDLALTLEGDFTPDEMYEYSVALPGMKTIDEMREWEVQRIQSEVARIWTQELYLDPVQVYTMLLGFSEEKAKELFQGSKSEFVTIEKNKNAAKSSAAAQDKKFAQRVREALNLEEEGVGWQERLANLKMLCDWKLEELEFEEKLSL